MVRISETQAVRQFLDLLTRVFYQGTIVELERGNKVKYLYKSFSVFTHRSRQVCNLPVKAAGLQTRRERCWETYGQVLIARISPVAPESPLKVKDLNRLFVELPSLGEDAKAFTKDVSDIRKQDPPEQSQWV